MGEFGIETETLEFKESTSQLNRAIESLSAMLNKHGEGEVLFGVNDKGEAIGQEIGNKTLNDISHAVNAGIKPTVTPAIAIIEKGSKKVVSVKVKGLSKPYSGNGLYLIRAGSQNKKIEPSLLKDIVFLSSPEASSSMTSLNQNLSFFQLKQLYSARHLSIDDATFEENAGLFNEQGKYNELANILSDENDVSIKVVRFGGEDKTEMLYRNEYGYKCLILAMNQVIDYVESLNETRVNLTGAAQREEIHLFDSRCFREAWVNACLHNRWSSLVPPAVYIYSNRMEIISMGGLPIDFPEESFFKGVSHPINRQLQKIMGQLGIVEQTGHGIPLIVKKYGKEAFDIASNHILVTFPFPFEIRRTAFSYDGLSPTQRKVLFSIGNQPTILTKDLASLTGVTIARINQIIKELKDLGRLRRVGSNKSGYWEVIDK